MIRTFIGVPGVTGPPPPKLLGLMGLSGKESGRPGGGARPSQAQQNWTRGLGRGPPLPSFSTPLLSPLLLVELGKKETYSY